MTHDDLLRKLDAKLAEWQRFVADPATSLDEIAVIILECRALSIELDRYLAALRETETA